MIVASASAGPVTVAMAATMDGTIHSRSAAKSTTFQAMATATEESDSSPTKQLAQLIPLSKRADSVELKLTFPSVRARATIRALELDPLDAQIRQVFFFDTPDLTLDHGRRGRARAARAGQGRRLRREAAARRARRRSRRAAEIAERRRRGRRDARRLRVLGVATRARPSATTRARSRPASGRSASCSRRSSGRSSRSTRPRASGSTTCRCSGRSSC